MQLLTERLPQHGSVLHVLLYLLLVGMRSIIIGVEWKIPQSWPFSYWCIPRNCAVENPKLNLLHSTAGEQPKFLFSNGCLRLIPWKAGWPFRINQITSLRMWYRKGCDLQSGRWTVNRREKFLEELNGNLFKGFHWTDPMAVDSWRKKHLTRGRAVEPISTMVMPWSQRSAWPGVVPWSQPLPGVMPWSQRGT